MALKLFSTAMVATAMLIGGCATTKKADSPPAASAKAPQALTAKDITDRYAALIYGKGATPKHSSMTMKGTIAIEQFSIEGPISRYATSPDSNVTTIELMGMTLNTGCHKGACWTQQPGAGTSSLSGDAAALQLQQADYTQWQHLDRFYTSIVIEPAADGKESSNYRLKAMRKNGDTDYYEFSKETGLLLTGTVEGDFGQGRMKIGLKFANYKEFDGVMVPTEMTQSTPQATMKLTFNEVSFGPIPEANLTRP